MKKTRQANLELLRLLAMVFVVTAHLMNHGNLIGAAKRGTASYYLVWTLFPLPIRIFSTIVCLYKDVA